MVRGGGSRRLWIAGAGWASFGVGALWPVPDAQALSCGCLGTTRVLAPAFDAIDVPVDTKIWIANGAGYGFYSYSYYGEPLDLVLIGPDGEETPLEVGALELLDSTLTVGIPTEPLEPHALYQVWSCQGTLCGTRLTQFTTANQSDDIPPSAPQVVDRVPSASGGGGLFSCGSHRSIALTVEFEHVLVVDLGDADLDPDVPAGNVSLASTEPTLDVGVGLCGTRWLGDPDAEIVPRYGAFDLSGNFSGWREGDPLALPDAGCGCMAPGHDDAGAWAWLMVLAVVGRRRRP